MLIKVPISKGRSFMSTVLLLALLIQSFVPNEYSAPLLVLVGLLIFIVTLGRQDILFIKLILPLLVLFLIGLHGVFSHETRHILRDIVFAVFPLSLLFIGYWIAGHQQMRAALYKLIFLSCVVLAINHLSTFIQSPELLFAGLEEIREKAGKGTGGIVVIGLILAIFRKKFSLGNIYPEYLSKYIVIPILLSSFILSYSRTEFLMFIVTVVALSGLVTRIRFQTILFVFVSVFLSAIIVVTTPDDETGTLRSKFSRSFTEVATTGANDDESINNNWRAFETSRAMMAFESSDIWEQTFGQGFGALVDIGIEIKLGADFLREIPIFHNGFVYVLIKTGIAGLLCYLLFYAYVIRIAVRYANSLNVEQRFQSRLLLGCVLSLMLMMLVVGGMPETAGAVFVVLIGYLCRRIVLLEMMAPLSFSGNSNLKSKRKIVGLNRAAFASIKRVA